MLAPWSFPWLLCPCRCTMQAKALLQKVRMHQVDLRALKSSSSERRPTSLSVSALPSFGERTTCSSPAHAEAREPEQSCGRFEICGSVETGGACCCRAGKELLLCQATNLFLV